jgi:hypothetical protein
MWLVLQAIIGVGGSASIREIEMKVVELGAFTSSQQCVLHKQGPGSELSYRQAWARTQLKAAGALDNGLGRGVWSVTEWGRTLQETDMPEVLAKANQVLRSHSQDASDDQQANTIPDDSASRTSALPLGALSSSKVEDFSEKMPTVETKIGLFTIPTGDESKDSVFETPKEASEHTEVQWLLLRLGADMGFNLWVARNDRGREYKGQRFSALQQMKSSLPLQFDEVTLKTIELIDVLWLRGNAIEAAFEIESTTSIYSGLLRMADLITMQPNLKIPLYIVAPDDRRNKVRVEVNRPTFSLLEPAMSKVCRYISFTALRKKLQEVSAYVRYLRPEFLKELSESCAVEES